MPLVGGQYDGIIAGREVVYGRRGGFPFGLPKKVAERVRQHQGQPFRLVVSLWADWVERGLAEAIVVDRIPVEGACTVMGARTEATSG
jgi:hypothetical protein